MKFFSCRLLTPIFPRVVYLVFLLNSATKNNFRSGVTRGGLPHLSNATSVTHATSHHSSTFEVTKERSPHWESWLRIYAEMSCDNDAAQLTWRLTSTFVRQCTKSSKSLAILHLVNTTTTTNNNNVCVTELCGWICVHGSVKTRHDIVDPAVLNLPDLTSVMHIFLSSSVNFVWLSYFSPIVAACNMDRRVYKWSLL